jgi:WD40 repeat protein
VPAYLAGVLLGLGRFGAGLRAVARLRASSTSVTDPGWLDGLERWRRQLGIHWGVALGWSRHIRVPMTVGWRWPVVLLPQPWMKTDNPNHCDAVLLHELAHIQRADYLWQLLLRLVQVVYWVHPLTWLLEPLVRSLRERACDDLCVYWMQNPQDYRRALLEVALALKQRRERVLGLAMVRSSRLGRRLAHIDQSSGCASCLLPRTVRLGLQGMAFVAATLIGAVELAPRVPAAQEAAAAAPETVKDASTPPPTEAGLAKLERAQISAYELKAAGGGDPAKAPAALVAVLGDSRLKHALMVNCVAFSPNGKLLATTGGDAKVRLWNPETGEEQRSLPGRPLSPYGPDGLLSVAFSPDGQTVAAGSAASAVFFWDVATGREQRVLPTDANVNDLAFSRDGRLLATGHELDAQVWDLGTGQRLYKLAAHAADFRVNQTTDRVTVAFAPDGKILFVGHPDGTLRSWDLTSGKLVNTIPAHDSAVQALAISKDGKYLATGSRQKVARLWEAATGRLRHTLEPHKDYVQAVAFEPTGKSLVTGGIDGQVRYWDVETGKLQQTIAMSPHGWVSSLAFSPDGKALATGGPMAQIWGAPDGLPRFATTGHIGSTDALAFSSDGRILVTGGADGTVKVWDLAVRAPRRSHDVGKPYVAAVAVSPDGATVAALSWGKPNVWLWDVATGQRLRSFQAEDNPNLGSVLAFSPDGHWLAAGMSGKMDGNAVTIWDLPKGKLHGRLTTARGPLFFSSDGKKLITAGEWAGSTSRKPVLAIWDVATLHMESQLEEPAGLGHLRTAALSSDGRTLALSGSLFGADDSSKNVVVLWNVPKQQPRLILETGKSFAQYLDFAPDGRSLVSLGWAENVAQVWDPRDGKLRESIRLSDPGVYRVRGVRFAHDSRHIAAAMGNGTVYVLRTQPAPEHVPEVTKVPARAAKVTESPTDLWKRLQNQPAPELRQLKGWLFGKPTRLADLRGKHVLLHFWNWNSEWEMPHLMLLHELFGDRGLGILVLLPDYEAYGATEESRRKEFATIKQRSWGGHEPPFPVALDGGGETAITGTLLKGLGATHAAYRIPDSHRGYRLQAITLLIGPEGQVVKRVDFGQSWRTVAEFEAILGKKAATLAGQVVFEQLYGLGEGQLLRRVAPPFPAQRTDYLLFRHGLVSVRGTNLFHFDGKLALHSVNGMERLTLADALEFVAGLKAYEVEGPLDLLKLEVAGDWVVRKGAAQVQLVRALEVVVREELKQPVRIKLLSEEREILVAQGRYQFQPLAGQKDNSVHLFAEALPPQTDFGGGGSGTLQEMLNWLGNRASRRVLLEAEAPRLLTLRWRDHLASHVMDLQAKTPAGADKLKAVLDNVSKQTGLQFRNARRQVLVWQVVKEK